MLFFVFGGSDEPKHWYLPGIGARALGRALSVRWACTGSYREYLVRRAYTRTVVHVYISAYKYIYIYILIYTHI